MHRNSHSSLELMEEELPERIGFDPDIVPDEEFDVCVDEAGVWVW